MSRVSMYKSVTDEAINLAPFNRGRVKDQVVNNFLITEAAYRDKTGYYDNYQGDREFHAV